MERRKLSAIQNRQDSRSVSARQNFPAAAGSARSPRSAYFIAHNKPGGSSCALPKSTKKSNFFLLIIASRCFYPIGRLFRNRLISRVPNSESSLWVSYGEFGRENLKPLPYHSRPFIEPQRGSENHAMLFDLRSFGKTTMDAFETRTDPSHSCRLDIGQHDPRFAFAPGTGVNKPDQPVGLQFIRRDRRPALFRHDRRLLESGSRHAPVLQYAASALPSDQVEKIVPACHHVGAGFSRANDASEIVRVNPSLARQRLQSSTCHATQNQIERHRFPLSTANLAKTAGGVHV